MKICLNLVKALLICTLFFTVAFKAPQWHAQTLINYVGPKVVKVISLSLRGGGTGVHITNKYGETYILTNKHVCGAKDKNELVGIVNNDKLFVRKVIKESIDHDLCLVEPVLNHGISLGSKPEVGQVTAILGHPQLSPLRFERAQYVVDHKIKICIKPLFIFCEQYKDYDASSYNANILPGNSGSPVVDWKGSLISLIFAGGQKHMAFAVPYEYIEGFINE